VNVSCCDSLFSSSNEHATAEKLTLAFVAAVPAACDTIHVAVSAWGVVGAIVTAATAVATAVATAPTLTAPPALGATAAGTTTVALLIESAKQSEPFILRILISLFF
jgi:hypothetical protein